VIRYIAGRIVLAGVLLISVISACFGLVSLIPGDPAQAVLGEFASPEQVADLRGKLGLDQPLLVRWWDYVSQVMQGNLGNSYFSGESISHDLLVRLPTSLLIVIPGLTLAILLGVLMGTVSAYYRDRLPDRVLSLVTSATLALPEFALALILIYVFFQMLGLAPAPFGMLSPLDPLPPSQTGSDVIDAILSGSWAVLGSMVSHVALPVLCLGIFFSAYFARVIRTGLSAALRSPQVEFARACGLSEFRVYRYAMSDIRRTLLTYLVILTGSALSGAVIIETVFSWPGIGTWALQGILKTDIPVIQGFVLVIAATLLMAYVAMDVVITFLDPRVRMQVARTGSKRVAKPTPLEIELSTSLGGPV
jgi:ABC-type dipeptide/oligopeptide/nickel transport system permease component